MNFYPVFRTRRARRFNQSGFSLIEVLIVVAIILIIAAIAIPNLLRSKIAANEASAVKSLHAIQESCIAYEITYGIGFPAKLANLGPGAPATAATADLLDTVLSAGVKSGYSFTYTAGAAQGGLVPSYKITAQPLVQDQTGTRWFYADSSGTIRQNVGAAATSASRPLD
jgi:type IV pilus assembly protein PilA